MASRDATVEPITSSVSDTMLPSEAGETKLPLKKIPGDYGLPFIGPIKDRLDYFYNQGRDKFFKSKIQKYQSTVIRTNMPPGPFIASNPKVIALLDGKSFPILFDVSKLFKTVENELNEKGQSSFEKPNEQAAFNFFGRAYFGSNPVNTKLGTDGPSLIAKWVLFQLAPVLSLGLPKYIEDLLIHTFPIPSFLVKKDYKRLYDFFYESAGSVLDEAEKLGISREEACHNLLFATCFNTFGGMKIFFPNILKWIGNAGPDLHRSLAKEIRSVIKSNGGELSLGAMEQMPLMKSVVYEAFRIEPPVPAQYAKAKVDLLIESHDAVFEVKKGEMLFGYQPFATKDPRIFERAEEFVPERFMGVEGEKLLKHVFWSNGPETEHPTVENKQCAGKEFVVLISRLFVVELFRRYDTFEIEVGTSTLGAAITIKSLNKTSF
ncbi:hypothetical protein V6Z12_D06G013500 [Gossypium hirsutum]